MTKNIKKTTKTEEKKDLMSLAGTLDEKNYKIMMKVIKDLKKMKARATPINYDL